MDDNAAEEALFHVRGSRSMRETRRGHWADKRHRPTFFNRKAMTLPDQHSGTESHAAD
jgi:hypothetical protein